MKIEALILLVVGVFFAVIAAIYWFTAYEDGGTMMLIGSFALGMLPGGYYLWWSRRMKPRPEDLHEATIEDGQGIIDAFPSSSIWPFGLGFFLTILGIALGFWLIVPGVAIVVSSLIGVTAESRRGGTV